MTTLSELDNLDVDVEVAAPDQYVDSSGPSIVPEGMYDLVITEWDATRNRETKDPDGKGFVFQTRVVGGDHDGRIVRNLRVWNTPYLRNGAKVSGTGDLIRAIDDTAEWTTVSEAAAIFQKAQDQGMPFRCKLNWEAFDAAYYEDKGGKALVNKSPEQKALRKEATIKGMANFRQAPDGTFLPEVEGPSGNFLEARLSMDRYVPSGKRR